MSIERLDIIIQKTLPLVYDDSLSYLEFLAKVVAKVNEAVDELNIYLNQDLRSYVVQRLEEWQADGTLDQIISDAILNIGDRQYTEQNYVTNDETITDSIDAIDTIVSSHLEQIAKNVYDYTDDGIVDKASFQNMFDSVNDGDTLLIPNGFFTIDNSVSPLTLSKNNITIIWKGTLKATHKADLLIVTGSNFKIHGENGVLQGRGGTDAEGFCQNRNDPTQMVALVRVQGDHNSIRGMRFIDQPAYGVRVENNNCFIAECIFEGGMVNYVPPNIDPLTADYNMSVDIKFNCHDVIIRNCEFIPNAIGGRAATWIFSGGSYNIDILDNRFESASEHNIYNVAYNSRIIGNNMNGETCEFGVIQHSGEFSIISNNIIKNAPGSALACFNSKGSVISGNKILNFENTGISVGVYNNYSNEFNDIKISDNYLVGNSNTTKYVEGILISTYNNISKRMKISGNTILNTFKNGNSSVRGAIRILGNTVNYNSDYIITGNNIENGGQAGIYATNLTNSLFCDNVITNMNNEDEYGGFLFNNCVNSKIYGNLVKDTRVTPLMLLFVLEATGAGGNEYYNNQCVNMLNINPYTLNPTSFMSYGNKKTVGKLSGTFTMGSSLSLVINSTISPDAARIMNHGRVILTPKNASAALLQTTSKAIFVSLVGSGSFTVLTADGTATGVSDAEFYWEAIQ